MSQTPSPLGIRLTTGHFQIDRAFRLAMGDIFGNILPYQSGILKEKAPCLAAGLSYPDPWTRDAAFNTWSGAGVILPEVMKNTLLASLTEGDPLAGHGDSCFDERGSQVPADVLSISGQYWDRIIWTIGAWAWYCQNGDKEFLKIAHEAVKNSFPYLEENEYDEELKLFRGGACIADGMGAYGDIYSNIKTSGVYQWPEKNPDKRHPKGAGLPLMAMSTNCLYAESYRLANLMAAELGYAKNEHWETMHQNVVEGIQTQLWDKEGQYFHVYTDPFDSALDRQECLGNAFALLFNIATDEQRAHIVKNQPHLEYGPPAVWPDFPRYKKANIDLLSCPDGRDDIAAENHILSQFPNARSGLAGHGGGVWPLMMGIWGEAVLLEGEKDYFLKELNIMAEVFCRAVQCPEIIHPDCGAPGGCLAESKGTPDSIQRSVSCYRQTWSATSYFRMILHGIIGMRFSPQGLSFEPHLPNGMDSVVLENIPYREAMLNITILREEGPKIEIGGKNQNDNILIDLKETNNITLRVN